MGWPHGRCSPPLGTGAERVGPGLRWWGQQKTQEGVDMKRLTRSSVIRPQSGPHRLSSLRACRKAPKVLNLIFSESPSYSLPSVVHCDHEARCTSRLSLGFCLSPFSPPCLTQGLPPPWMGCSRHQACLEQAQGCPRGQPSCPELMGAQRGWGCPAPLQSTKGLL